MTQLARIQTERVCDSNQSFGSLQSLHISMDMYVYMYIKVI